MEPKFMVILPLAAILILTGSATAHMAGNAGTNGWSDGDRSMGPSGHGNGGPRWEGSGSQRPLDRGFSFNCNGSGPEVAVVDNSSRGISMGLYRMDLIGTIKTYSIIMDEYDWELKEVNGTDGRISRTYSLEHAWSPDGPTSKITSTFELDWKEGSRFLRFKFNIDRFPVDGSLRLTYGFRTESASSWGSSSWRQGNGGLVLGNDRNEEFCKVDHYRNFTYDLLGTRMIAPLTVSNGTLTAYEGILMTEGLVRPDISSAELIGYVDILDTFISTIGEVLEDGIDYMMDHLVSFLIGGAFMIIITGTIISIIAFRRKDGPEGLILDRNPYYKGPTGPDR